MNDFNENEIMDKIFEILSVPDKDQNDYHNFSKSFQWINPLKSFFIFNVFTGYNPNFI